MVQNNNRTIGTVNDTEREQWVLNDEGLYNWWRSERVAMQPFLRANREEIDRVIRLALDVKPAEKTWRDYN